MVFLNGYNGFRMVYKDYQMFKIKKELMIFSLS